MIGFDADPKARMVELVEAVNAELGKFAPNYRVDARKAISRMNRDTRFSTDKSPYKTEISVVFPCRGREKHEAAGFFFAVAHDGVDICIGAYMPGPEQLAMLRKTLAKEHAAFRKIIGSAALTTAMGELQGEQLKRVPKEFPADHPAGELLRFKQFYLRKKLPIALATTPKLLPELVQRFRSATPFVEFLDAAL